MRRCQRIGNLHRVLQRLIQPQAMSGDQPVERLSRNELHGDEVDPVSRINVVDRDDVGMIQC